MCRFDYFVVMENIVNNGINWTVVWSFLCCILAVAASIAILYIRDLREKQKLYKLFEGPGESILVFSPKMEFLYGTPIFSNDIFFKAVSNEHMLERLLPAADWIRISTFLKDLDKHPNMPFVFLFNNGGESVAWYELRCVKKYFSSVEFHYVCFVKNISRETDISRKKEAADEKLKMLLSNTGDFLWNFEIENRSLTILTQVSGDQDRVLPMEVGEMDVRKLLPQRDYDMLLEKINGYVIAYRKTEKLEDGNFECKLRGYRTDRSYIWYLLRCKLAVHEDGHLYYTGVARRMDLIMDNPLFTDEQQNEALLASIMSLPELRFFWVDRKCIVQGCNQAFANDVKVGDPKLVIGKTLAEVTSGTHSPMFVKRIGDVFDTKRSVLWKDSYMQFDRLIILNALPLTVVDEMVQQTMCVYTMINLREFDSTRSIKDETEV